jgi:acyl-coenzyme A synthetase/AMP-(fatty) acid ligase
MLQAFLQEPELEIYCTSLRQILVSGEAFPAGLQKLFFERLGNQGILLHNLYGPTEAAIDVASCRLEKPASFPLGRPVANARIHLLDWQLHPVPVGVAGQLYIGGVQLARGYDQRPDLTAESLIPDPFSLISGARLYASGDLARYEPGGSIEYLGRLDHQVKIRGFRIELGEIESALTHYPHVGEAVVAAQEGPLGDSRLVAYVVSSSPTSVSDLRSFLMAKLPEHMVPAIFIFMSALPLTPNGKIDRRALPAPAADRPELSNPYVAPRNPTEWVLAEIWGALLGIERIGIQDSFFSLGGHSLLAIQLMVQINQKLQGHLGLTQIFESPTIEGLAELLRRPVEEGLEELLDPL